MSGARALALRLQAPGDFHTHSPSCLPSILPLPIIVNQGGVVSAGGAVRREIAKAAGGAPRSMAVYRQTGGHWGPPFKSPPKQDGTPSPKTFFFFFCSCDVQSTTGEKRRGENLDREQRLTPLRRTSSVGGAGVGGLSARWRRCFLSRDGLVRKMT